MPLAISSYERLRQLQDAGDVLNLAWTSDERSWLATDLSALIARELTQEVGENLPAVYSYLVQDPYGEHWLRDVVAKFFGLVDQDLCLTSGAGVNSLLHGLAGISPGPVYFAGPCYPDFPEWVTRRGGRTVMGGSALSRDGHIEAARAVSAGVAYLERPSLLGDRWDSLSDIEHFCTACAQHECLVVIDESNANYCPVDFSAARLLPGVRNLIVLRGLSKAYGLGGLRFGFCLSATSLRERVRQVVPPMLASSLSLRIAKAVHGAGDVGAPLRERIQQSKGRTRALLASLGIHEAKLSSACLPFVFLSPADGDRVTRLGVQGKLQPITGDSVHDADVLFRISVPLAEARWCALRARLGEAPRSADSDLAAGGEKHGTR